MSNTLAWVAGVTAAVVGVSMLAGSGSGSGSGGGGGSPRQRLWTMLRAIPELTEDQRGFLMVCAGGETGQSYRPTAHNGTASERLASSRATDNNPELRARVLACGVPDASLRTGSWGVFQRLAPYLAGDAFEVFGDRGCEFADPTRTSLAFQVASAIETARDLQGYASWVAYPTVGNLRLGWAAPALMGYLTANAERIARYRRQARETGYPESFIDKRLTRFPANVAAIYERVELL